MRKVWLVECKCGATEKVAAAQRRSKAGQKFTDKGWDYTADGWVCPVCASIEAANEGGSDD